MGKYETLATLNVKQDAVAFIGLCGCHLARCGSVKKYVRRSVNTILVTGIATVGNSYTAG
jgi:hypothetical protein